MRGHRVCVEIDGEEWTGTVSDLQYTRLAGAPVAVVSLDEPLPDGRTELTMGVDELREV